MKKLYFIIVSSVDDASKKRSFMNFKIKFQKNSFFFLVIFLRWDLNMKYFSKNFPKIIFLKIRVKLLIYSLNYDKYFDDNKIYVPSLIIKFNSWIQIKIKMDWLLIYLDGIKFN